MGHAAFVIETGCNCIAGHIWELFAQPALGEEAMIRKSFHFAVIKIINAQANFDQQCTTFLDARLETKIAKCAVFQSSKPGVDREHNFQCFHIMRCIVEQSVSFHGRLTHQSELIGFKIFDAAVNKTRRRGAGSTAHIGPLNQ